jgi:hypothetical protein
VDCGSRSACSRVASQSPRVASRWVNRQRPSSDSRDCGLPRGRQASQSRNGEGCRVLRACTCSPHAWSSHHPEDWRLRPPGSGGWSLGCGHGCRGDCPCTTPRRAVRRAGSRGDARGSLSGRHPQFDRISVGWERERWRTPLDTSLLVGGPSDRCWVCPGRCPEHGDRSGADRLSEAVCRARRLLVRPRAMGRPTESHPCGDRWSVLVGTRRVESGSSGSRAPGGPILVSPRLRASPRSGLGSRRGATETRALGCAPGLSGGDCRDPLRRTAPPSRARARQEPAAILTRVT